MKKWFVDCKVEIGCACVVEAKTKEEAKKMVREAGWNWNNYETDRAHYEIEMDACEL